MKKELETKNCLSDIALPYKYSEVGLVALCKNYENQVLHAINKTI